MTSKPEAEASTSCLQTRACGACDAPPAHAVPWWVRWSRWRQQSPTEGEAWEAQLLKTSTKTPLEAINVPVGPGPQDFIHTVHGGKEDGPTMVMAPGYAAGLGFYFRNFDALAPHFRLYAFDWLGTGNSGRPAFNVTGREAAEDFFLSSLRRWKQTMGIGKMVLVGHSLGGYLSACYALKYPEDVEHLILVCPAGVPEVPDGWADRFTSMGATTKALFKTLMWAWERGVTPGGVVRTIGPFGPGLIEGYVTKRLVRPSSPTGGAMSPEEASVFHKYMYQITAAPGSGEFALRHLLAPGAWAHAPLEKRLHELKVPVTFVYGETDWMNPGHAVNVCRQLRAERAPRNKSDLRTEIIDEAGHFVMLEQPHLFNRAVVDACASVLGAASAKAAAASMPAKETAHSVEMSRWSIPIAAEAPLSSGGTAGQKAATKA
ncbi:hypothetical protein FOA52_000446 [Chlamydomonas sp. UWO 241]|nr:hypothetical protein FOA52_000446 [Chlamydomonas sp. UWO 241]